ncbi:uncharacterized protein TNCV_1008421 [Trichonephila clavipes]|nr:uncharacterized protein TNCV_1008421 [Trichonephila clavipes]
MMGYAQRTKGYRIWLIDENKLVETINVRFDENKRGINFRHKVNSNLGYNLNLPDYYDDEDDSDRAKDSLTSRLVSKTSTEMPSTSEKPNVSSDNHSLIPCTEVKWIRNIGRKVTGSNVYYSIEGEATRLKSFNEIEILSTGPTYRKYSEQTTSANQKNGSNALPPPLMLKIDKNYRIQVDTIKKIYPHLRLKTTGEYIKLYSNTTEQNRVVRQTLIQLGYRFYVITPKNERPIKVVIKGFPKKADPEDIKKDLENEGFEPERVTQLIGRRTKQKLPIFQVTLPRTIENLKIFLSKNPCSP